MAAKEHDSVSRRILGKIDRIKRMDMINLIVDCMDIYANARKLQG